MSKFLKDKENLKLVVRAISGSSTEQEAIDRAVGIQISIGNISNSNEIRDEDNRRSYGVLFKVAQALAPKKAQRDKQ